MKVAFVGACNAILYSLYFKLLERFDDVQFVSTFKPDSLVYENSFNARWFFRNMPVDNDVLGDFKNPDCKYTIKDADRADQYLKECDHVFYQRFGWRPDLDEWNGSDCDYMCDPELLHYDKESLSNMVRDGVRVSEISRLFYRHDRQELLDYTKKIEADTNPTIRSSESLEKVKSHIDKHALHCPWIIHQPVEFYLENVNQICEFTGVPTLTDVEHQRLSAAQPFTQEDINRMYMHREIIYVKGKDNI